MRLQEFNLDQAVQFHDELNPHLWNGDRLRDDVKAKLVRIAEDFKQFISISNYDIVDITISGSNAAFSYTPKSDIDLHLVVMIPEEHDPELRQLFDAKKYQYNDQYDFKIHGYDVEVYVQDATQPHHSMGIYSIFRGKWVKHPQPIRATVDDSAVAHKYHGYKERIKQAIHSNNAEMCNRLWHSIKDMRTAGLARCGEFGVENLTFKMLRAEGDLGDLKDHITALKTQEFSLQEQA
jgi:hypothetical protein